MVERLCTDLPYSRAYMLGVVTWVGGGAELEWPGGGGGGWAGGGSSRDQ